MATRLVVAPSNSVSQVTNACNQRTSRREHCPWITLSKFDPSFHSLYCVSRSCNLPYPFLSPPVDVHVRQPAKNRAVACVSPSSSPHLASSASTRIYVCGLSFRTTKESLQTAFEEFGQLVEVNLVMDKIANRPRGFAFISYATEEESKRAIEGMHGKFLDGRVIFVEVARPRSKMSKNKPKWGELRH